VPVVNLSIPGAGNETIHRRTYEYFFEDLPNNNNPLYIIGWSQTWRKEEWCRKYYNKYLPNGYQTLAFPDNKPRNFYEAALLDNWSEEDFFRRTMLARQSINSLFKANNVPHLTTFFANPENLETPSFVEKFKNASDYLDKHSVLIEPMYKLTAYCKKLPCGHDGLETMEIISNYIHGEIISKYGNIEHLDTSYLMLKDFNSKDSTEYGWE
jgi:hypothetical protein